MMTQAQTILSMLEDPESDNDELDARIWCFVNEYTYLGDHQIAKSIPRKMFKYKDHKENEKWCVCSEKAVNPYMADLYTTSLDAAMSIGAKELEGWGYEAYGNDNCSFWMVCNTNRNFECKIDCDDLPRAICHARIQALEWHRGK